ncbi:hypothetical protein FRX31_029917 [Thalictrum thalictroides]|uniref:F-box domain-containing protein n=1 Tax=Thalictrum thalictroides TaxID=46969 RepID=A0A7J6V6X7_THATH|nr:hypothetical protein FRX31_029917 [Thalictrum thalictroides]
MSSVNNLPKELVSKILQKLPAKFLTQVKSVCKLWYKEVSRSDFARSDLVRYREEQKIVIA